jgi:hypothetical protein
MKPGQLELLLDYPACMALASACPRLFCPYNLGERAKRRCAMAIATVTGGLEVAEIAKVSGLHRRNVDLALRSAIRKLGPKMALVTGKPYDQVLRPCRICHKPFRPEGAERLCSDACRQESRERQLKQWKLGRRAA